MRSMFSPLCVMTAMLLLTSLGCSRSVAGGPGTEGDWVSHKDPLGFKVTHPPKWVVETNSEGRIVVRSADTSAFVVIQPFLLHADMTARYRAPTTRRSCATSPAWTS